MSYVKNLSSFIEKISDLNRRTGSGGLMFRGHKDRKDKAEPSVLRTNYWRKREHEMLRQLLAQHPTEFSKDSSVFELLARAQHYGLPTRLLDITSNPLVALYFACEKDDEDNKNKPGKGNPAPIKRTAGEVVVFLPGKTKTSFFDSEEVAVLCSLSYLSYEAKQKMRQHFLDCYEKANRETSEGSESDNSEKFDKVFVTEFNNDDGVQQLLRIARKDNSAVGETINPFCLSNILAVLPRKLDERIASQSGAFLVFGLFAPESERKNRFFLQQFQTEELYIAPKDKAGILSELEGLGINDYNLFPSLDRTAAMIKSA